MEGEKPGPLKEPEQKARKNPPEAKRSGKFMQGLETQAAWTKDVKQREAEACGLSMTVYKKKGRVAKVYILDDSVLQRMPG